MFGGGGFSFSVFSTIAFVSFFGASFFGAALVVFLVLIGGIFGVVFMIGGLSVMVLFFVFKLVIFGFVFGGANLLEAEKRDVIVSIFAFGGGAKVFVLLKLKFIVDRLNLVSEVLLMLNVVGDEMGEIIILSGYIVGTCDLMCSAKEREFRSANGDLEVFERVDLEDCMKFYLDLCIKKYMCIVDEIMFDMV